MRHRESSTLSSEPYSANTNKKHDKPILSTNSLRILIQKEASSKSEETIGPHVKYMLPFFEFGAPRKGFATSYNFCSERPYILNPKLASTHLTPTPCGSPTAGAGPLLRWSSAGAFPCPAAGFLQRTLWQGEPAAITSKPLEAGLRSKLLILKGVM